jgi:transposase
VRDDLEQRLFERDRDPFAQDVDVMLIDTTSIFVYRDTETAYRKRGFSKDRRPDEPQIVLCVVVN